MKPLVSIVIPAYNRVRDLERALHSVVSQTEARWEALIVDNHSTDDLDGLVRAFNDSRLKMLKIRNQGVIAASRNLGIRHAQGDYIAFLDSDDWWKPRKLAESLRHLESGADVVYHDLYLVTRNNQQLFLRKAGTRDLRSPVYDDLLTNGNALVNSSVVMRRETLLAMGPIDEDREMNPWCDFSAWLRAAKHTEKFVRIPLTLGYYWMGGGNTTSPTTTLSVLDRFEQVHAAELERLGPAGPSWFNYAKGKAHYRLKSYSMAEKSLGRVRTLVTREVAQAAGGRWGRRLLLKLLYYNITSRWMLIAIRLQGSSRS